MAGTDHTPKDNGVSSERVSVLSFEYNHETHQVSIGGTPMQLSLAQMIAGEGLRVLEEQRKLAGARLLRQQLAEEDQNARIAASLRNGR